MLRSIFIFMFYIMVSWSINATSWTIDLRNGNTEPTNQPSNPIRQVVETEDGYVVSYSFENALIEKSVYFDDCITIQIPGFYQNKYAGEPAILVKNDFFTIPTDYTVDLQILNYEYIDINMQLQPSIIDIPENHIGPITKNEIAQIKEYSGYFPTTPIHQCPLNTYRGINMYHVEVNPTSYDYINKIVRLSKEITYRVSFIKKVSKENRISTTPPISIKDHFLENSITPKYIKTSDSLSVQEYLIIATSKSLIAAKRLAMWKKLLGYPTSIISRDDWTPQLITTSIQDFYNSHPGLYFLLLFGNYRDIPPFEYETHDNKIIPIDYGYGCLDGPSDNLADIYRGRIPNNTELEANIIVDKIINYEQYPIEDSNFYNNITLCAEFTQLNGDDKEDRAFVEVCEQICNYLSPKGYNITKIYNAASWINPIKWQNGSPIPQTMQKPNFQWDGNTSLISNTLQAGTNLVFFRGHGSWNAWSRPSFSTTNIESLQNARKLPIVFSICCSTGKFNEEQDCFAYKFLKSEYGGCSAIIAASDVSLSVQNDVFSHALIDAIWPTPGFYPDKTIFKHLSSLNSPQEINLSPIYHIGQIMDQAEFRLRQTYGYYSNNRLYHCFGDPSMRIHPTKPKELPKITVTRTDHSVHVSMPSDKAQITFYDEKLDSVYTYNGRYKLHTTPNPLFVQVCVNDTDKIPFVDRVSPFIAVTEPKKDGSEKIVAQKVQLGEEGSNVNLSDGIIEIIASEIVLQQGTTISPDLSLKLTCY